jgi:DNA polymerase III delta prime subunit
LENHNIELVQEFFNRVKNEEIISAKTAEKLFKISKSGITGELLGKFNNSLEDNKITNTHQLVFLLLSGLFDNSDFKKYLLLSADNKYYNLEGQRICFSDENAKFIKLCYLLDKSFFDLRKLLQLNNNEYFAYNENNKDDIIATRFLFTQGFKPDILESNEKIVSKLDYLYEGYKSIQQPQDMRDENWEDFLGIISKNFVFNGIQAIGEKLPNEFIKWCDKDRDKTRFFQYVGVYVGDSPIEKLRKYLLGKTDKFEEYWKGISETLLLNTLTGLSHSFKNEESVSYSNEEKEKVQLVEDIIEYLLQKNIECPRIIYQTTDSFILSPNNEEYFLFDEELHQELKGLKDNRLNELYKQINIVKQPYRENNLTDSIEELETDLFFITQDIQENNEPFYPAWSKENDIKLFRVNLINYRVIVKIEEKFELGTIERGNFYIEKTEEEANIYYTCSSLDELKNKLSEKNDEIADKLEVLIERRDSLLKSFYNTLSIAGDDETNKILQVAIQEQQQKEDRERLTMTLQEEQRYSYNWFKSYLEILKTYSEKGNQQQQKSLSFQEIKRYSIDNQVSDKYFLLCGASSYIPSSIEDSEDFKVILKIKSHKDENIKVEGVSKKGQDLLIYCPATLSQQIISQFLNVLRIEINFTPTIDLLDRLFRAFTNDNFISDKWEDINEILPALHYIYGPPGTGKTTTLCNNINGLLNENSDATFLILTPTNKAADVLCKKLRRDFNPDISIARLGGPTDPELEDIDATVYKNSLNYEEVGSISVVASTIHRLPYFEINGDQYNPPYKLFQYKWDYIIFDESSMAGLHYLVFAIIALNQTNPDAHFIIAGDPKQIPPVVEVNDKDLEEFDFQDENIYKMMKLDNFKPEEQIIREQDEIQNLWTQYRSVKQIGQLFSELSYEKLLKHDRETNRKESKPLPEGFKKLISSNVTFIDIPLNQDNSIYKINKLLYSSYQTYCAILVTEIIKYFDKVNTDEQWTIGLIAPYKAQAILLNKLVTSYGISDKVKIYADTVHGFQGDECDIVFFVCNPNNYQYTGHPKCLLSKEYIYNVAISRAKDYLIILHPYFTIKNNSFINNISQSYRKNFGVSIIKQATEVEKILFNDRSFNKSFIAEYSYTTGHDNVNVFGLSDMEYFIKANDNAIDIQLKK